MMLLANFGDSAWIPHAAYGMQLAATQDTGKNFYYKTRYYKIDF